MSTTAGPLDGWDVCSVTGCPLGDPDAAEPDNIDEIEETGIAHGVRHVNISDHWWIDTRPQSPQGLAGNNTLVLAAAAWLAHHEGADYCIRSTSYAGEWDGYQLLASDLLRALDGAAEPTTPGGR
ncbi:hypothetical protein [Micromonospora sp. WMMD737]|uniref:hypothetical protein n=1 Tax=Micromonospora sp. WMMD737 TaxID=3404113 RepID=UPI003B9663C1